MKKAIEFAREFVKENPDLEDEVWGLLELCEMEIDEGGSVEHEVSLCIESIKQLKEKDEG